jgi:hypothetical protein
LTENIKIICPDESDFMNEMEYVNCDKHLHCCGLLTFAEIVQLIKTENKLIFRHHRKKNIFENNVNSEEEKQEEKQEEEEEEEKEEKEDFEFFSSSLKMKRKRK